MNISTINRRGFLTHVSAAATLAALEPTSILARTTRGQVDPSGRFGSILDRSEFDQAPRALSPAILALFASQTAMRDVVRAGAVPRYVLSGLPPVMMQGTPTSLGYPGACEAAAFGYGLGTYTAAHGFPGFDPQSGPADQISAAWLFAWAQHRVHKTGCQGSKALPYLGLLIAKGAPSALQFPYQPKCKYIDSINTDIDSYSGLRKFAIGSYKTLPHLLNGQSTYLTPLKQYVSAGHAIAFSGLVAQNYNNPAAAMSNGAFAPSSFIPGSGHAQVIVGFDDSLGHTGAFLIQNSFGTDWPYMGATDPLMQGRLWWTYESFFASQGFGSIAYPVPQPPVRPGSIPLGSPDKDAPAATIMEAVRTDHDGRSFAAFEINFAQPVQFNTLRVTPPRATSPVEGGHNAPIKYGFAQVSRGASFPAGRYAVELDAHTLSADLSQQKPITYRGHVTIS